MTCALTLLVPNAGLVTRSHCVWPLTVLRNAGETFAGTVAGSNGSVMVTGNANVVPCGVKANIGPMAVIPAGNAGAPEVITSM